MKKAVLISLSILVAQAPALAHADRAPLNVLLALGGPEARTIEIGLSPDGRSYVIDSATALGIGSSVCWHPPGNDNQLICRATDVRSFEVNTGGGDDTVTIGKSVAVPATLRGGPGNDSLTGGAGPDKLSAGDGDDRLAGRGGADSLYGGAGIDTLIGGWANDRLRGGPGEDLLAGGPGADDVLQ